jgi:site-specific recombinase XerD
MGHAVPSKTKIRASWNLASVSLQDGYTAFILSRQAMDCTRATMLFYQFTAGSFVLWLAPQGDTDPAEVTARHVRAYLSQLIAKGRKDTTLHAQARAIRTQLRFWYAEDYLPTLIKFDMPKLSKKRLPVLTADQLKQIVKAFNVRGRAIILFMVDSGLRRGEVINLNWADVDMTSGLVRVRPGKGRKDRSAVMGARTRRALLAYRRTLSSRDDTSPLFQTDEETRFTGNGLMMMFRRLSARAGIDVTAHALRRTFAILSLRAGMSPLHLQNPGGWADLEMVNHYAQMVDEDLLREHKADSPVDNLSEGLFLSVQESDKRNDERR